MHLCNTGTKGSKARYVLQRSGSNGFTNSTHRTAPALEVARGRGRARYIWWQHPSGGSDCYFPEITSCRGQAPHCKPETASTQTPGGKNASPTHSPKCTHAQFTRTILKNTHPSLPPQRSPWHQFVSGAEHWQTYSPQVMAAICEASHTKLLLQLIVNFGLFFIFFYWVLMVQQACLRWEGRVEEEMNCQSVFSLAWWDTCSVRPALIEFLTDCLIWSSTKLSLMGFNTCGMRNMQRNKKKKMR